MNNNTEKNISGNFNISKEIKLGMKIMEVRKKSIKPNVLLSRSQSTTGYTWEVAELNANVLQPS